MVLTDVELEALATELESDRVERKESFKSSKEKIAQAICAFANDLPGHRRPGYVLIGVKDDGSPSDLPITDELLLALAGYRSDGNILPLPSLVISKRSLGGKDVALVEVQPTGDPPVRYYGQTWVRVGPRRGIASRDEERILTERRRSADLPDDARAVVGPALDDLDLTFFRDVYLPGAVAPDVLEENGRTTEEQLAAVHLLARDGIPTRAALLLTGKAARSWVPGLYLQFVRLDGTELDDPIINQKEVDGTLSEILRRTDDLLNANIAVPTLVEGRTVESRQPDYPISALQQLVRNAFMHRTYDSHAPVYLYWFVDRIEIHSPGGLFGRVTPETFGQQGVTDYRNPSLAQGLKVLGYVQRFGMGIGLARKRCEQNGNPVPEFTFSPSSFLSTVRRRP